MWEAQSICLQRGKRTILDQVDLPLELGQVTTILGPNGAGKSTLLRILTGSLTDFDGTVTLDQKPLHAYGAAELARRRAVMAQHSFLQFDFTVEEVVLLGRIPHLSGWESEHDRQACDAAIEAVDLEAFRHRHYPTLSGGEKQRVHLARVLAQLDFQQDKEDSPGSWLFLDEPTSSLDLRFQHSLLEQVRALATDHGFGVCAVLHDLNLAMAYADQVLILDEGRRAALGPPRETLTPEIIESVYQVQATLLDHPKQSFPTIHTQPIPIVS